MALLLNSSSKNTPCLKPLQTLNATEKPLAPSDSDPGGQRSKEGSKDKKSTLELGKQKGREQPEPREGAAAEPDSIQNGGDPKEPPYKKTEKRQSLGGFFKGLVRSFLFLFFAIFQLHAGSDLWGIGALGLGPKNSEILGREGKFLVEERWLRQDGELELLAQPLLWGWLRVPTNYRVFIKGKWSWGSGSPEERAKKKPQKTQNPCKTKSLQGQNQGT